MLMALNGMHVAESDKEFDAMNNALIAMPCSRLHTASLQRYKVNVELVLFETSHLPQSQTPPLWTTCLAKNGLLSTTHGEALCAACLRQC
jgi:hypothetical protein